jgi:NAD-dependent dihydropyrimidine dehydrogenase PreA subunit
MIIISLHPSPDKQQAALQEEVVKLLENQRLECLLIPPLLQIAESCEFWPQLAEKANNPILACWLHPRPASWLLQRHRISCEESKIINLHECSDAASAYKAILIAVEDKEGATAEKTRSKRTKSAAKPSSHKIKKLSAETGERWYPIIDGSRCVNCGHCLQFCLFGVYELDAQGQVQVRNPDLCKNGCPACSRICPQSAIMFPLYEKDAAIAGAPNQFVALDAAARRMFYTRTKQTCPECGRKPDRKPPASSGGKKTCPECGGPLPDKKSGIKNNKTAERPAFDDLDQLVEQLDKAMQRRPKKHE